MKNTIYLLTLVALFFSCSTKEEKSEKLIKDYMFRNLYDFSSYEPIETKIDSAYTNVYMDSTILHYAYLLNENIKKVYEYIEKGDKLKKELDFEMSWINISSSSRKKAEALLIDIKSNIDSVKKYNPKTNELAKLIRDRANDLHPKKFLGWMAQHKFRCKTKGGNYDLKEYVFVFDKNIKEIIYQIDSDDKDLEKMYSLINESLIMDTTKTIINEFQNE